MRTPTIELLFEHGRFAGHDRVALAKVLPYYLLGMLFLGCSNLIVRAFYALKETRSPAVIGIVAIGSYFALSGLLSQSFGHLGIATAYAVTWALALMAQTVALSRRIGPVLSQSDALIVIVAVIAAVLGGWIATCLLAHFGASPQNPLLRALSLASIGLLAMAGYAVVLFGFLRWLSARSSTRVATR
jgi:putative peptidoglycan lipid II flippase